MDKLTQLSPFLDRQLGEADTPLQKFIIARDQAYFKTAFFSGDWPGGLGQLKVPEILLFPNDDGFSFNHIWGKTLRDGDHNVFGHYLDVARQIDLTRGYLFRPTTPKGGILDSPFSSAAEEAWLKLYL